jgi:prepilin-type N-terminal cleavage/methylation domain-containing protein
MKKAGFSLIEVLVSILLVVSVASASLTLHFTALNISTKAGQRTQAYFLAKQGVEAVRIRKMMSVFEWNTLRTYPASNNYVIRGGSWTVNDSPIWTIIAESNNNGLVRLGGDNYYRYVNFENNIVPDGASNISPGEYIKLTVRVCYGEAGINSTACIDAQNGRNYIETVTYLTNL